MEYLTNKSIKKDGLIDINDINEKYLFLHKNGSYSLYKIYVYMCSM
jgi:hypothetical protein